MNEIIGRDFYFRRVYDGKPGPVLYARVWDAERFMEAEQERGDTAEKADRFTPQVATVQDFIFETRKK